jgi:hypothetical protein
MGTSAGLSLIMCRAIRSVLLADDMPSIWSQRTRECVGDLRQKLAFLKSRHTAILLQTGGRTCWLTFAGTALNLALAEALSHFQVKTKRSDDFAIWFDDQQKPDDIEIAMRKLSNAGAIQFIASNEEAEQLLKYSECLPADLLAREIVARRCAESDLNSVLAEPRQMVSQQELFTLSLD